MHMCSETGIYIKKIIKLAFLLKVFFFLRQIDMKWGKDILYYILYYIILYV